MHVVALSSCINPVAAGGKSLTFQLPVLLREPGVTVVVSPVRSRSPEHAPTEAFALSCDTALPSVHATCRPLCDVCSQLEAT